MQDCYCNYFDIDTKQEAYFIMLLSALTMERHGAETRVWLGMREGLSGRWL